MVDDCWRGTSDSIDAVHRRAATTPLQRLAWLEEALVFAGLTGALQADRRRRQAQADLIAAGLREPLGAPLDGPGEEARPVQPTLGHP